MKRHILLLLVVAIFGTLLSVCDGSSPAPSRADNSAMRDFFTRSYADGHIAHDLKSTLNLTPTQLKLLAGHTLNMITSRCGADDKKMSQLQKYISKMIAYKKEKEILAGTLKDISVTEKEAERFSSVLQSMIGCSKLPKLPHADISRDAREGITPSEEALPSLEEEPTIDFQENNNNAASKVMAGSRSIDTKQDDVILGLPTREPVQVATRTRVFLIPFSNDHVDRLRLGNPELKVSPNGKIEHSKELSKSAQNDARAKLMSFLTRIWGSLGSVFSSILHGDIFSRGRRSAAAIKEEEAKVKKTALKAEEEGRASLLELFSQVCRIYCSACNGPSARSFSLVQADIIDFKMAIKELSDYLVNDESFATAASLILDKELLDSIKSCGKISHPFLFPITWRKMPASF